MHNRYINIILILCYMLIYFNIVAQTDNSNNKETYFFSRKGYLIRKHNYLSIFIEKHNKKYYVLSSYKDKKLQLITNDTLFISEKEWNILENYIKSIDFFNLNEELDPPNIVVFDGTTWILNGAKGDLFNSVKTKMGNKAIINEVCLYMIKLSGLKLKNSEIY